MKKNQQKLERNRYSQTLSGEELTKTQVLNLTELQKVANYEKRTSKRPAIFVAILGLFAISLGIAYPSILNLVTPKYDPPVISKNRVSDLAATNNSSVSCTSLANTETTSLYFDMNLNFVDNKLDSYTKKFEASPIAGKEEAAVNEMQYFITLHKNIEAVEVPGYIITDTGDVNKLTVNVSIDLKKYDATKMTEYHNSNLSTKVEYSLNETKESVVAKATAAGYTCK